MAIIMLLYANITTWSGTVGWGKSVNERHFSWVVCVGKNLRTEKLNIKNDRKTGEMRNFTFVKILEKDYFSI